MLAMVAAMPVTMARTFAIAVTIAIATVFAKSILVFFGRASAAAIEHTQLLFGGEHSIRVQHQPQISLRLCSLLCTPFLGDCQSSTELES